MGFKEKTRNMPTRSRPPRPGLKDETGHKRTLLAGAEAFDAFGNGPDIVFLGLGPDPAAVMSLVPAGASAVYVECPDFATAMPEGWQAAIPAGLRPVAAAALTPERVARSRFFLYRQNPRLFPTFWGRVLAHIRLAALPAPPADATDAGQVLLVRPKAGLLEPELARALTALGLRVTDLPAQAAPEHLPSLLSASIPALFLSVNGAGLDPDGLAAALLAEAGVPVALWCVDNPFHVLSRFRAPFWKRLHLFVTDDWFITPLRELGAGYVHHLPLAASQHFFQASPSPELEGTALFVGRSAFPDRDRFFAGCRVPQGLSFTAGDMLGRGQRPDFGWWVDSLGLSPLWPGKAARLAGCGAETTGLAWRAACLGAVGRALPLTIYGDGGWRELAGGATLHGPVDYYGELAGLYAGAAVTVNLTSLLLPRGLTQRHFDVWAAGGFLLTDATPGLGLFPEFLLRRNVFHRPEEAAQLAKNAAGDAQLRSGLTAAWRAEMTAWHTYEHRLKRLLEVVSDAGRP